MNTRVFFYLTALSGMVGMLSLICASLFRSWIANTPIEQLNDEGLDQLHFHLFGATVANLIAQFALPIFFVFLVLYLVSKFRQKRPEVSPGPE